MAERKKGDRSRLHQKDMGGRAKQQEEEEEVQPVKKRITRKTTDSYEDPFFRKGDDVSFDEPIIAKPDPTKFDEPIIATDKLDSIKKRTDDDLK